MRAVIAATAVCSSAIDASRADDVEPASREETRIPAEELSLALFTLGKDRNLDVIFVAEDVRGMRTGGVGGVLTVDEALNQILSGTGLTYRHIDRKTIMIVPAHSTGHGSGSKVEHKASRTTVNERVTVEEVLVTARKRKEDVQNVPASISIIGGAKLEEWGATQLTDYAAYLSGISVVQGQSPGQDMLIIRGLGLPSESALVGTYIDDTPIGASSSQVPTTRRALDLLPYDFERIEVLEGPQGTLYGANAMGGLVKFVTRKPDLDRVTARTGVDFKENDHASAAGWNARGSINLPIVTGKAALRVSFSQDLTPGFIDEPNQNRRVGNQAKEEAGRVALLLEPSETWSADLSALIQHLDSRDGGTVTLTQTLTPDTGPRSNSQQVPDPFESRLQYYSASINRDLQGANFISGTSYLSTSARGWTQVYYPLDHVDPRAPRAEEDDELSSSKLTQEFRLVSPAGGRLDWLLGTFYTDERGRESQVAYALDAANVAIHDPQLNPELSVFIPSRYREYALFGDTTWKFTEALGLTVGLRESHNEETYAGLPTCSRLYTSTIARCGSAGAGSSNQSVFNFTISPSYLFSPDVMVYLRVASGYRPGGPNPPGPGIPTSVRADTLINSELGIKSAWLDRQLQFDAAAYQIDWQHIQIISSAPPPVDIAYGANGNSATVRGLEAATILAPLPNLRLGLNFTYTHAVLSAPMPSGSSLVGNRGDRLPYIPNWSGSLTADYTHALRNGWVAALGAGWRYTGQRYTTLNDPRNCPQNCAGASSVPSLRPYGAFDLRASVSSDPWSARFTVRNLTNKQAWVDLAGTNSQPFDASPILATALPGRLFTLGVERRF